ncbi:MAG: hypothetical protein COT84_05760 [Chlamydiae bacterium CG10_big_fil_rev_8_21_14_0_10_35_9]|nr:MAG: hypothetical protein COT84_05760 [Chlamydiae bacterium CG10_big_fil_rev_8_21_14_0_10_35_9]
MEKKIYLLSENVINQIAAGEVIENPASALKELVDNALDAKSSHILVEIRQGGLTFLKVEDDGHGMTRANLELSIQRHATSKITSLSDLFALKTMGFRGEALSSIASIAKMSITSSFEGALACSLSVSGGKIEQIKDAARKKGTTIEVKDLFFNTPARKKFQKAPARNTQEVIRVFQQFALGFPEISFTLIIDGKQAFFHKKSTPFIRVQDVFGKTFANELKYVEISFENIQLKGFLGIPKFYKRNKSSQFFYVNNRKIHSSVLSNFLKKAYGTRIAEEGFPSAILFLDVPLHEIDVNVHPQKKEVRFSKEGLFQEIFFKAVQKAFDVPIPIPQKEIFEVPPLFSKKTQPLIFDLEEAVQKVLPMDNDYHGPIFIQDRFCFLQNVTLSEKIFIEGVVIADLKGIYELLLFELFSCKDRGFEVQSLIVPIVLEVGALKVKILEEDSKQLQKLGLDIRAIDDSTIAVDAMPVFFQRQDLENFLSDLLIDEIPDNRTKRLMDNVAKSAAKKTSFTPAEVRIFLKELKGCKDPFYSPKGKPTLIQCRPQDIQKLFNAKGAPLCLYQND